MAKITIQRGDTLSALSKKHGSSIQDILKLNPNITDPNKIFAGSNLNLPDSPTTTAPTKTPAQTFGFGGDPGRGIAPTSVFNAAGQQLQAPTAKPLVPSPSQTSPLQAEIKSRGTASSKDVLLSSLTKALESRADFDPAARLTELKEERNIPQLSQTIGTFEQEIAKTNTFLEDLDENIRERTKEFLVSEPQRARIESVERGDLVDQLSKLTRGLDVTERAFGRESQDILQQLSLESQKSGQPLENLLQELEIRGGIENLFAPSEEKVIEARNFALDFGVTQPFYQAGSVIYNTQTGKPEYENVGGEIRRLSDGRRYENKEQFFADSGLNSFDQVQKISGQTEQDLIKLSEGQALIDPNTGEIVYKNPKTFKPSSKTDKEFFTFGNKAKAALLAAGFAESEITDIRRDILKLGIEAALGPDSNLSEERKQAVREALSKDEDDVVIPG